MKPKQLLPLVVILAALAGLVAYRQMQREPASIEQQYALKALLPAELDKAKIAKIELYAGAKPETKLVLERDGDAGKWKLSSRWDAPVAQDKIDKFLGTLAGLSGEFRATVSGDGQKEYSLDDATGFHVIGYASGAAEPSFHLINGKSPDFGLAFARSAGSDDVHLINVSLRREAGIFTLEMGDAPEADVWLDKTMFETPSEKIKAVSLVYPDKELSVELREKAAEAPKPEENKPEETPGAEKPAADKPAEAPAKQFEWAVAKGGLGTEFHANAGANLARRLSRINATDLVDPAKKADYGLEPAQYRATLTIEGQEAPLVIEAGRPAGDTYAYFRVAGRERDLVYKVSGADFEQIFYKGGEFFELPGVLVDKGEVDAIEYTTGGRTTKLAREGETWKVVEPKTELVMESDAIDNLVRTLISWKAEDYADAPEGKSLDAPVDKVIFRGPKIEHTIELGGETPAKGRYARLDGRPQVLVMAASDVPSVFVPYANLFQAKLFDVASSSFTKITLTKGGESAVLERKPSDIDWTVAIGGGAAEPAEQNTAEEVAGALAGLVADDFDFTEGRPAGTVFGTAAFTTPDGKDQQIQIEIAQPDGKHPVTRAGSSVVYLLPKTVIENVFVDFAKLKPAPAPASAPAAAPAVDGVAPAADAASAPPDSATPPAALAESAPAPADQPK